MLRCSATNEEGFACLRSPSHEGGHHWDRCETTDSDGHRCTLRLRHAGNHELPWYDRLAAPGEVHTIHYGGTERETGAIADRAARMAAGYGWVRESQTFRPGLLWRWPPLRGWLTGATQGRLTVVFEFRPPEGSRS